MWDSMPAPELDLGRVSHIMTKASPGNLVGSDAQERGFCTEACQVRKPPVKAGKNCYFHSADEEINSYRVEQKNLPLTNEKKNIVYLYIIP